MAILKTLLISMTPILEIRGAIPVGLSAGLTLAEAYFVALIGNLLPVPLLVLFTRRILEALKKRGLFKKLSATLEAKAAKSSRLVEKYKFWGLALLVAVPLPGTGAWTGALVASLANMRLKSCLPSIAIGVAAAGLIVLGVSCAAVS